jgi:quinol monooxygenase YgiN
MAAVQHMVLVRFKPETSDEMIRDLFAQLAALRERIPGILHYSGGPYSSPEGLNQGYTHGFLMTFRDAAARDAYLPHPEHERVKEAILPWVEGVVAFDFEMQD